MTTLRALRDEVAARHRNLSHSTNIGSIVSYCKCGNPWPCPESRLVAALSDERLAAGLDRWRFSAKTIAAALLDVTVEEER
jgi:hypothetical protein